MIVWYVFHWGFECQLLFCFLSHKSQSTSFWPALYLHSSRLVLVKQAHFLYLVIWEGIYRLRRLKNRVAESIIQPRKATHISPCVEPLHWLLSTYFIVLLSLNAYQRILDLQHPVTLWIVWILRQVEPCNQLWFISAFTSMLSLKL